MPLNALLRQFPSHNSEIQYSMTLSNLNPFLLVVNLPISLDYLGPTPKSDCAMG